MSEPIMFWYERTELNNPIAVVGFPSIGLVGSIITSFMARELKLNVAVGMTLPDIQQYTLIQDGNPYPPIRIYAGRIPRPRKKKKVKPTEGEVSETPLEEKIEPTPKKRVRSRDIIIVTSEIAPKPEQAYEFTAHLIGVLQQMGATDIIFVDGIPRMEPESTIMAAYTSDRVRDMIEEAGIKIMDEGLIRGMSGVALFKCKADGVESMCLISPANPQLPDPRAAADLVEPLMKLIPRLSIDPTPLFKEAEDIDTRIRSQTTQQNTGNQNIYG